MLKRNSEEIGFQVRSSEDWACVFFLLFIAVIPVSKAISSLSEGVVSTLWVWGILDKNIRTRRIQRLRNFPAVWFFPLLFCWMVLSSLWTKDHGEILGEVNMMHYLFTLPIMGVTLPFRMQWLRWTLGCFVISNLIVVLYSLVIAFQGKTDERLLLDKAFWGHASVYVDPTNAYGSKLKLRVKEKQPLQISLNAKIDSGLIVICAESEKQIQKIGEAFFTNSEERIIEVNYWVPQNLVGKKVEIFTMVRGAKARGFTGPIKAQQSGEILALGNGYEDFALTSPFHQRPRASLFLAFGFMVCAWYLSRKLHRFDTVAGFCWLAMIIQLVGLVFLGGRIGVLSLVIGIPVLLFVNKRFSKIQYVILFSACLVFLLLPPVFNRFKLGVNEIQEGWEKPQQIDFRSSSMGQRILYYQVYAKVLPNSGFWGLGIGDMRLEASPYFPQEQSFQRPHNQFLDVLILYGVPGLVLFLWAWVVGIRQHYGGFRSLYRVYVLMVLVSFLLDSTLATQGGITFVVGFFSLFLSVPAGRANKSSEPALEVPVV